MTDQDAYKVIETAAMRLLARRDYSRLELWRKLNTRADSVVVNTVLDELAQKDYQSDQRFTDLMVRSRINTLCGPFKIRYELRDKGVGDDLIEQVIQEYQPDWSELARSARKKRFGLDPVRDVRDHARQARYLQSRGFSNDHIKVAMKAEQPA